jgi:hypothetical protein
MGIDNATKMFDRRRLIFDSLAGKSSTRSTVSGRFQTNHRAVGGYRLHVYVDLSLTDFILDKTPRLLILGDARQGDRSFLMSFDHCLLTDFLGP